MTNTTSRRDVIHELTAETHPDLWGTLALGDDSPERLWVRGNLAALTERQEAFWAAMPEDERRDRTRVDNIEVVQGYAADAILKRAESLPADMILMGSHAHGLTHSFLGTVAKRMLHRAKVPTLIVPYTEDH